MYFQILIVDTLETWLIIPIFDSIHVEKLKLVQTYQYIII